MTPCLPAVLFASLALAYDPPQDAAGPLTARIEGPSVLTSTEPQRFAIILSNSGTGDVSGSVRIGLIDGWQVDGSAAFSLPPRSTATIPFTITPVAGLHSAHYPIHAWVTANNATLHPVLIVETRLPAHTRPSEIEWKPVEAAPDAGLALWRLPVFRSVVQVFNRDPLIMPVAWQGSEEQSRANLAMNQRITRGDAREAIAIHPPWFSGRAGTLLLEFPIVLPADKPARLRFANAVRDPDPGQSGDGVTFRVRALPLDAPDGAQGDIVFERHTDSKVWLDGEADLARYAGLAVRLQLESHPGPRNNTSFDLSYWAEPTLITGTPSIQAGSRGLLDSVIRIPNSSLSFRGFSVRVNGDQLEDWRSPNVLLRITDESTPGNTRLRHHFRDFELVGMIWQEGPALRSRFWLENAPAPQPWRAYYIENVAAGPWNQPVRRVYAGQGNVLDRPEAFRLTFDGHRLATSFVGFDFEDGTSLVQAVDVPPTDLDFNPRTNVATLRSAHAATFACIPAASVWDAAKVWRDANGLKAAGGVKKLAGRFVFDLWGGRYADSAAALRRAALYGLRDAAVVWHNWQRWGYDYRLPDVYPPSPRNGTEDEFVDLVRAARDNGILFAPHDNYIDFYPDAEGFSYDRIAFNRNGQPIRAWLNESRQAQSYRWLTGHFWPFVQRNLVSIRDGFWPTAYFIDVWSSTGPAETWTPRGDLIDRVTTRDTWGQVLAWIRDFLGDDAPQISESGHDQLIGWLDGAQTNHLRVDVPPPGQYSWATWNIRCAAAERIPWLDFAHHDKFVLHGAGYESRYASGLNTRLHGIYSDDYITTEVLTGHPAMVNAPFSREVVRKYWLLHGLMASLALRRIDKVEFAGGDLHRQLVTWESGARVWVNRGASDWTVEGHALPQYGFYARSAGVEAAIERRDGVIVEWSRSADSQYVNARPPISDRLPILVSVDSIRNLAPRRFLVTFRWEVQEPAPEALRVFVHFVDKDGNIKFQGDHDPNLPTSLWQGTITTSAQVTVPDAQSYGLRIGLYNPRTGTRYLPEGPDDGTRRIHLGDVQLRGEELAFQPYDPGPDPWLERMNPSLKLISFDGITTNAAVRLSRAGGSLWVTPLPDSRASQARIRLNFTPREILIRDEQGNILRTDPVVTEGNDVVLAIARDVFACELR